MSDPAFSGKVLQKAPTFVGVIRGGIDQAYDRMRAAMRLNLPDSSKFMGVYRGHTALIVGGGSSVRTTLSAIWARRKLSKKTIIIAPNRSHDWLVSKGIIPDIGVMMDPAPWLLDYMTPRKDVLYFLGATLDPRIFEKFLSAGAAVVLTHYGFDPKNEGPGEVKTIEREFPGRAAAFVWGASTSGLRSIALGAFLGIDHFILHGFDSCAAPSGELYGYAKPIVKKPETELFIKAKGRPASFSAMTNRDMRTQIDDFASMTEQFRHWKVNGQRRDIRVWAAGDGAIPWMCFHAGEEVRARGEVPQLDHLHPEVMCRKYGQEGHFNYATGKREPTPAFPEKINPFITNPLQLDPVTYV